MLRIVTTIKTNPVSKRTKNLSEKLGLCIKFLLRYARFLNTTPESVNLAHLFNHPIGDQGALRMIS